MSRPSSVTLHSLLLLLVVSVLLLSTFASSSSSSSAGELPFPSADSSSSYPSWDSSAGSSSAAVTAVSSSSSSSSSLPSTAITGTFPGTGTGTGGAATGANTGGSSKPSPPSRTAVTSSSANSSSSSSTAGPATNGSTVSSSSSASLVLVSSSSSSSPVATFNRTLVAGEARSGFNLPLAQYVDYVFTPTSFATIDIKLLGTQGNPGLFVNFDRPGRIGNSTYYTFRAGPGTLSLRIASSTQLNSVFDCASQRRVLGGNCTYYISVLSYNNSSPVYHQVGLNYVLTVGHPGEAVELTNSAVRLDEVLPAGNSSAPSIAYYYFRFTLSTLSTPYFSVVLTPDVGEADLYVSTTPNPGPNNYWWSSTTEGSDAVSIANADAQYYYVAVVNSHSITARYSILARQFDLTMGSGVFYLNAFSPQIGMSIGGWYGFYAFYSDGAWPTMQITVDAIKGDPDIYINPSITNGYTFPNTTKYNDSRTQYGSDTITLYNPPTGYIYLSIYSAGGDSIYRITVTGEGRINPMSPGFTYVASLAANHAMYYSLIVSPAAINYANPQLLIQLAARSGNPDLYVSDTYRFPNRTHYTWTSILPDVFDAVLLTNRTVGNQRPALHNGTYYIAVHSTDSASSFTVTAQLGNRITLRDGVTQQYSLFTGSGQMMEVSYDRDQPFHISTITTIGLIPTYVYVSFSEDIVPGQPSTYHWSGEMNGTSQDVEVSGEGCVSATCRYFILVWAPIRPVNARILFSVVAHTATTALELLPGVEVSDGAIAGAAGYKHYYFELSCPNNTVSLFLTALTGNPDLFVRKGDTYPTRQRFDFVSDATGLANDVVSFTQNDNLFRTQSMVGRYAVSVQGVGATVNNYKLLLSVQSQCGGTSWLPLVNGQPQYGRVSANSWQYYTFAVSIEMWPTSVGFTLTATDASNPDMYVTKDGRTPTPDVYSWLAEADAGFDDVIIISNMSTNPTPCRPTNLNPVCVYRIAVTSKTASSYILTASTTGTVVGLLLESSRDSYVAPGGWQQYVVQVTDPYLPLIFIVSPLSGNPDLYVEYDKPATFNSLTSKTAGVDVITIPQPDTGRWYIGVHGAGTTANYYSIVASQRGIQLRNGRPQDDVLSAGEQRYYVFEFSEPIGLTRPFRLQLDSISFNPQLEVYIRRDATPSPTQNAASQISANGDPMHFIIDYSNDQWRRTASWRVLVISRTDNAAFSITAAVGAAPVYLSDGRPTDVGELVSRNETRYFRLLVTSVLYPLHITVNVVTGGNVTLFVSLTDPLPSAMAVNTSMNTSDASGSVSVTIPRTMLRPGFVYVGVRSENVPTRYTVVMSTGLTIMQAGETQAASCMQGSLTTGYIVYLPFSSSAIDDITISAVPADVSSANYSTPLVLYVTTNTSLVRPTAARNDWSFNLLDWETEYTITRNDPKLQACVARGNCELHVMVGCAGYIGKDIHYRFSVLMGVSYVAITSQQPYVARSGLMVGRDKYYSIAMSSDVRTPYTVRVEPCTGGLQLYANWMSNGAPSAAHYDAASTSPRQAQTITVNSGLNSTSKLLLDVRGVSGVASGTMYQLKTYNGLTFDYLSPSVNNSDNRIWLVSSDSVTDNSIKIYFMAARVPQAVQDGYAQRPDSSMGVMKYSVYWAYEPTDSVLYTMCGLNRTNLAGSFSPIGNNLTVTFKVPSDVRRYSVQVVAQYVWRVGTGARAVDTPATEGYLAYQYLVGVAPGSQVVVGPTGVYDDSSSTGTTGPLHPADLIPGPSTVKVDIIIIAFAIGVPLTTLVCVVLVFLHLKNQRLVDGDGIEMNEPFSQSASTGKGGRGGSSTFNRMLEDDDTSATSSGYLPPGQQEQQHHMSASDHYASTSSGYDNTYTQTGGGDFASGGSGGGGGGGGEARNWSVTSLTQTLSHLPNNHASSAWALTDPITCFSSLRSLPTSLPCCV